MWVLDASLICLCMYPGPIHSISLIFQHANRWPVDDAASEKYPTPRHVLARRAEGILPRPMRPSYMDVLCPCFTILRLFCKCGGASFDRTNWLTVNNPKLSTEWYRVPTKVMTTDANDWRKSLDDAVKFSKTNDVLIMHLAWVNFVLRKFSFLFLFYSHKIIFVLILFSFFK